MEQRGSSLPKAKLRRWYPLYLVFAKVIWGRVSRFEVDLKLTMCRIWRSTLILSFASCYLMWGMISFELYALNFPDSNRDSHYLPGTMASPHRTSTRDPQSGFDTRQLREEMSGYSRDFIVWVYSFGVEVAERL